MDNLELICSCVDAEKATEVCAYFKEKGLVDTVCYLWNSVWTEAEKKSAEKAVKEKDTESKYYELLFERFNMKVHYSQTDSHKSFIKKAYNRLKEFVPSMTEEDAEKHDKTKYNLAQAVGYTVRWVHNIDNDTWKDALQDHYKYESHHPQFHDPQKMSKATLQESLVDMVASRWERNLKGNEDATNSDLVSFDPIYLSRYQEDDRKQVEELIETIKNS